MCWFLGGAGLDQPCPGVAQHAWACSWPPQTPARITADVVWDFHDWDKGTCGRAHINEAHINEAMRTDPGVAAGGVGGLQTPAVGDCNG